MGNRENVKIAACYFVNQIEPVNFCRPETSILAFPTHHWEPNWIAEYGLFRCLNLFNEIRYYPCREWIFHEPRNLAIVLPASRWMVEDHFAFYPGCSSSCW